MTAPFDQLRKDARAIDKYTDSIRDFFYGLTGDTLMISGQEVSSLETLKQNLEDAKQTTLSNSLLVFQTLSDMENATPPFSGHYAIYTGDTALKLFRYMDSILLSGMEPHPYSDRRRIVPSASNPNGGWVDFTSVIVERFTQWVNGSGVPVMGTNETEGNSLVLKSPDENYVLRVKDDGFEISYSGAPIVNIDSSTGTIDLGTVQRKGHGLSKLEYFYDPLERFAVKQLPDVEDFDPNAALYINVSENIGWCDGGLYPIKKLLTCVRDSFQYAFEPKVGRFIRFDKDEPAITSLGIHRLAERASYIDNSWVTIANDPESELTGSQITQTPLKAVLGPEKVGALSSPDADSGVRYLYEIRSAYDGGPAHVEFLCEWTYDTKIRLTIYDHNQTDQIATVYWEGESPVAGTGTSQIDPEPTIRTFTKYYGKGPNGGDVYLLAVDVDVTPVGNGGRFLFYFYNDEVGPDVSLIIHNFQCGDDFFDAGINVSEGAEYSRATESLSLSPLASAQIPRIEGTVMVDVEVPDHLGETHAFELSFQDNGDDKLHVYWPTTDHHGLYLKHFKDGADTLLPVSFVSETAYSTRRRIVVSYKAGRITLFSNGYKHGEVTGVDMVKGFDTLTFGGKDADGNVLNGTVKAVALYHEEFTDPGLATLSQLPT